MGGYHFQPAESRHFFYNLLTFFTDIAIQPSPLSVGIRLFIFNCRLKKSF